MEIEEPESDRNHLPLREASDPAEGTVAGTPATRRPIKVRDSTWAKSIAAVLVRAGVKPNTISIASAAFAAGAGGCLGLTPLVGPVAKVALFVTAATAVQLRLLCNLFDGMVAMEGGFKTKSGEVFNELPDRFSDVFILVGCGYAARSWIVGLELGWIASVLAVVTAYVRALGAATGAGQNFCGPMAKPHRMAVVTAGCIAAALAVAWSEEGRVIWMVLLLVTLGSVITIWRRTGQVIRTLESR